MHLARIVKFAFIFIAIALTYFLLSQNNEQLERVDIPTSKDSTNLKKADVKDIASTIMKNPRFSGEDNKNRKWLITAKNAIQSGILGNENVELNTVKATITTAKNEDLSFTATQGFFSHEKEQLTLQDGINIQGLGLIIDTNEIIAHLKSGLVEGKKSVTVKTKQGNLNAGNFAIQGNGEKVVFSDGVKGTFKLRGTK